MPMSISEGEAVGFQSRRRAPGAAESGASMRGSRGMYVFFLLLFGGGEGEKGEREGNGGCHRRNGLTELTECVQLILCTHGKVCPSFFIWGVRLLLLLLSS